MRRKAIVDMRPKMDSRNLALRYESLIPQVHCLPNVADWQSTCRSLVIRRHESLRKVAQDLGLDVETAKNLVAMAKASIKATARSRRDAYVQSLIGDEKEGPRANAIGYAMYDFLRQGLLARYFVRDAVIQYAARARQSGPEPDSEVCEDLEYAKLLAGLVGNLGIADLAVRFLLTGKREIGSEDFKRIQDLDPPRNLSWMISRPYGKRRSPAGTVVGIEVVQTIPQKEAVVDAAFRSVILLAEVFEPWSFSSAHQDHSTRVPDAAGEASGGAGEQMDLPLRWKASSQDRSALCEIGTQ